MKDFKVSVVLCCFNSALRISETLRHLATQQNLRAEDWEIIVVNNSSVDNTKKVAQNVWDELCCPVSFKLIDEPIAGLTIARKRGILEANAEIILFCDDDNWLEPNYISKAIEYKATCPDLGIWGAGESIGVYEIEKPTWINPYLRMLAIFKNEGDAIATKLEDNVVVSGAGMCISKEFADVYTQFLIDEPQRNVLDRTGDIPLAGGDSDMHFVALRNNFKIGYFEDLKFKHFMPANRLTKSYLLKLKKYMIMSSVILNHINNKQQGGWSMLGLTYQLLKSLFTNFFEFRMTIAGIIGNIQGKKFIKKLRLNSTHDNRL